MKTITVSRRSRAVWALLQQARKEALLVRTPDGTEFKVAVIEDDVDEETVRTRKNKELKAFLQNCAKDAGTTSHAEVKRMFGLK